MQHYERTPGASRLFCRRVGSLILTIGIEFSRLYRDRFTGSFYLGPSCEWGYMLPDYPENAYQRVGRSLRASERKRLLDPFFARRGVVDAWWIGFDEESAQAFLDAVRLAEPRFLRQPRLQAMIAASDKMKKHAKMLARTHQMARQMSAAPGGLRHQPRRTSAGVPSEYHRAAEMVLSEMASDRLSVQYVELLARDAWRTARVGSGPA